MRTFAAAAENGAARAVTRALFVDLSGVLLDPAPCPGQRPGLRGGAGAALRLLDRLDYRLVMIAPCTLERRQAGRMMPARIADLLSRERIALAGICCCGATGTACDDCAPAPGLLLRAARDFGLSLPASWLLASSAQHVAAGRLAGCRTVLIDAGGDVDADADGNGSGSGDAGYWTQRTVTGAAEAPAVYRSRDIVDAALAIVRLDDES